MTTWYNPVEKLPEQDEKVLIRRGDKIEAAFFDARSGTFNLRNGAALKKTEELQWMQTIAAARENITYRDL